MTFPIPQPWARDSDEFKRDEAKRAASPASFFYSQGRALVLAAEYFEDDRLTAKAKNGVAAKHRHRVRLALFGQLMAAFEYMFKDFLAQAVDVTDVLDDTLKKQQWVKLEVERVLSQKVSRSTVGSLLLHPTLGWHDPEEVNRRFQTLFEYAPIASADVPTLRTLWIIRHSVAHNAGVITGPDAARIGASSVAGRVADVNEEFVSKSFAFLVPTAERLATGCGTALLGQWFQGMSPAGRNYLRDREVYQALKRLSTFISSRPSDLPEIAEAGYEQDWGVYA